MLMVTDNRFWRAAMGSQVRIASLLAHWQAQGHEVHLIFAGSVYGHEQADFDAATSRLASTTVTGLQNVGSQSATSATSAAASAAEPRPGLPTLRELRRAVSHAGHALRSPSAVRGLYRLALATQEPTLGEFLRPAVATAFRNVFEACRPSVVVVQFLRMAYVLDALTQTQRRQALFVVDTHDVQHERRARFHERQAVADLAIWPHQEAAALRRFDLIMAIQARDAEALAALCPGVPVVVAGHPVDFSLSRARAPSAVFRCLFLGSDMAPNVAAANQILAKIWPPLQLALGAACRLTLAGGVCDALAGQTLPVGVSLAGRVASLETLYRNHDALISPIDMGGGLKIKNVEALSAGLAVVTSPQGAEGLESGAGSALQIANCTEDFVRVLSGWAHDAAERQAQQQRAAAYADAHFGVVSAYGPLDRALAATRAGSAAALGAL